MEWRARVQGQRWTDDHADGRRCRLGKKTAERANGTVKELEEVEKELRN